jgi:hypothetical protein
MKSNNDLQNARKLLDELKALPPRAGEDRTFLQIAGYAHDELVCSKLLKFFFDPTGAHGFGYLFLKALLGEDGLRLSNVSIETELPTESGARIDLVIYSKIHLVGIENKINHTPINPFPEYWKFLTCEAKRKGIGMVKGFLLTLRSSDSGIRAGFEPVTYDFFFGRVQSLREKYDRQVDDRYKIFLTDFLNTMKTLQPGVTAMTPEELDFLAKGHTEVVKLLGLVNRFKEELCEKIERLQELIKTNRYRDVKTDRTPMKKGHLHASLTYTIGVGGGPPINVEATVSADGWDISVYHLEETHPLRVKALLDKFGIQNKNGELDQGLFKYDSPVEDVQQKVEHIIAKIAKPYSRKASA